ncbi:MAG: acyl-CoA-binding protein [Caldilineaceae bacterium]|nr:acyl-CoA-binding protein [Caldilineaceae bacterium]
MSDLQQQFAAAAAAAKTLATKPDNDTLLQLYALYKQASVGDAGGKRPGFADFVGRAKYDAWAELRGTPQATAMQRYIDLVATLQRA